MHTINPEVIIANYFAEKETEIEMKLSTLNEIKTHIENVFKNDFMFVDNTWNSISDAVYSNPKYFSFNDSRTSILFNPNHREVFYQDVYAIFNTKVDKEIKYRFLNELENLFNG